MYYSRPPKLSDWLGLLVVALIVLFVFVIVMAIGR